MKLLRSIATTALVAGLAGVLSVAVAPAAHAQPVCREATMDDYQVAVVCAWVETNPDGTTFSPTVWIGCQFMNGDGYCTMDPIFTGATGYEPNPTPPPVFRIDPRTLSVYSDGGYFGWVWVNGESVPVLLPAFCVGDPSVC